MTSKIPKAKTPGRGRKSLRNQTLARDNFQCLVCGENDKDVLQVDHMLRQADYPQLSAEPSNLITLCANCHAKKSAREMRNSV